MKNIIIVVLVLVVGVVVMQYIATPTETERTTEVTESSELDASATATANTAMVSYYNETAGYLAVPEGEGPFPALVLIHEWWGLNDNIKSLADDFAEQGYVALAVDLYNGELAETPDQARVLATAVRENVEPAFANLEAATQYLAGLEIVDGERLASVGWCFGGQWAYNMAVNNMNVDATVMYYGRFMPEDDLSMMRADILGHFGEADTSIPIDTVREFEAKLSTLEGDHAVFIYPNAGHAFANEDNEEAYNEEAAQLAWERTLEFLSREVQ
jgi:carboxymethylenebutenolidase